MAQLFLPLSKSAELWGDVAHAFETAAAPRLPLDQWVQKRRQVIGGPRPGKWNSANAPFSGEPMRAISERWVQRVSLVAPTQLLKSEFAINIAIWTAEYGNDVLFYEPDLPLLKEFLGDRIRPTMQALGDNPIIESVDSKYFKKRDSAIVLRSGGGGGKILGLSPEMKTGKSSHTAPIVVIDELDKMQDPTMITSAQSRVTTYEGDACIADMSTPTIDVAGTIWRSWTEGSRGVWKGRCCHCDELVSVRWSRVSFEKDDDGFWLPETAAFICENCGTVWSEADRQKSLRAGCYVHEDPENPHQSFHIPGPAHIWRSIEQIATVGANAWRGAIQDGTWEAYQVVVNEWFGEVWTDEARGLSSRRLQRTTYDPGPAGEDDFGQLDRRAVLITAGTDVGAHALYTEIVAWGIEPATGQVLSWALAYKVHGGTPESSIEDAELWREYEKFIDGAAWRHPGYPGAAFRAQRVLIDSGYRPEIVRAWCTEKYAADIEAAGGSQGIGVAPYAARILPSKSKARETGNHPIDLSAGLRPRDHAHNQGKFKLQLPALVSIESNPIKDAIYESVLRDGRLPEEAPRANYWPAEPEARGYSDRWFKEFAAEIKRIKRNPKGALVTYWDKKTPEEAGYFRTNEAWDCRVYACAAALTTMYPRSLQIGLLLLAIADASRDGSPWTSEELEQMRAQLKIAGGQDYAMGEAENVVPIDGGSND